MPAYTHHSIFRRPRGKKAAIRQRQPAHRGTVRIPSLSCFHPILRKKILRDAERFNAYPSFIIAGIVATYYDTYEQTQT